jgi:hypothetical protein
MSKKGRKMSNGTGADKAYFDQKFSELSAKLSERLDETDRRITEIENKLKSSAPGLGESAPLDWQQMAQMFFGPTMPVMPGMMLPPAGPWTIWWAWWLSWFVWPFALPLAATRMFPHTSRFAAARAQFFGRWFEALARMTQQAANVGPFMGYSSGKPVDSDLVKKALNQEPLRSLSQEQKSQLLWAVQCGQMFAHALQR